MQSSTEDRKSKIKLITLPDILVAVCALTMQSEALENYQKRVGRPSMKTREALEKRRLRDREVYRRKVLMGLKETDPLPPLLHLKRGRPRHERGMYENFVAFVG